MALVVFNISIIIIKYFSIANHQTTSNTIITDNATPAARVPVAGICLQIEKQFSFQQFREQIHICITMLKETDYI